MNLRLSHTFLYVRDQDEALRFYTEVLGMQPRTDAQMETMRWLTVGPPEQPELEINLFAPGPPMPPDDAETVRQLLAKGSLGTLIFLTDDCRAAFERVRDGGAEVMQSRSSRPTASSTARSAIPPATTSASASRCRPGRLDA